MSWTEAYAFPLDKHDGKGLQMVHIYDNFAKPAEALDFAERKAREAVEMKKMAQKEKEKKKEKLREVAQMTRDHRAEIKSHEDKVGKDGKARERDEVRHDRGKERQQDRNISRACPYKTSKLQRKQDRDISEVISLGVPNPRSASEAQYDQRLFDQSKGMDSGFAGGEDKTYNVYDKPFRGGRDVASHIYRPSKNIDKDAYAVHDSKHGQRWDGPVQFEEVPLGLDKFFEELNQFCRSKRPSSSSSNQDRKRRK